MVGFRKRIIRSCDYSITFLEKYQKKIEHRRNVAPSKIEIFICKFILSRIQINVNRKAESGRTQLNESTLSTPLQKKG